MCGVVEGDKNQNSPMRMRGRIKLTVLLGRVWAAKN